MYVVILSLYISNNMDSPVDVGGFAEPRKILCLGVLYLRLSKYQYTPGPRMGEPEFPYKLYFYIQVIKAWMA